MYALANELASCQDESSIHAAEFNYFFKLSNMIKMTSQLFFSHIEAIKLPLIKFSHIEPCKVYFAS